jgi:hypothetical protein
VRDAEPLARLEEPPGGACALPEQRVVTVEAVEQQARDGGGRVEAGREPRGALRGGAGRQIVG